MHAKKAVTDNLSDASTGLLSAPPWPDTCTLLLRALAARHITLLLTALAVRHIYTAAYGPRSPTHAHCCLQHGVLNGVPLTKVYLTHQSGGGWGFSTPANPVNRHRHRHRHHC